jgi:hypothetical protein
MSDDRTKADKAWEARQEAARYRIFHSYWAERLYLLLASKPKLFSAIRRARN